MKTTKTNPSKQKSEYQLARTVNKQGEESFKLVWPGGPANYTIMPTKNDKSVAVFARGALGGSDQTYRTTKESSGMEKAIRELVTNNKHRFPGINVQKQVREILSEIASLRNTVSEPEL